MIIPSPSWIEGGKGFKGILDALKGFTLQNFSPMNFFKDLNSGENNYFDYDKFRHFQETSILKETLASGWRGRN